jgi:hypothetical protein
MYTLSGVYDINDQGTIVGWVLDPSINDGVGFRRIGSTVQWLSPPSGHSGRAIPTLVDENDIAYGYVRVGGIPTAIRWDSAGTATFLDSAYASVNGSVPHGINSGGIVVGTNVTPGYFGIGALYISNAWAWDPAIGTITDLGPWAAYDINDDSVAAGGYLRPADGFQQPRTMQLGEQGIPLLTLLLEPDSIHPRVRPHASASFPFLNQAEIEPDTLSWSMLLLDGMTTLSADSMTLRAEYLGQTGGHDHLEAIARVDTFPEIPAGQSAAGLPFVGHFLYESQPADIIASDSFPGAVVGSYMAGHFSGQYRLIGTVYYAGLTLTDTTEFVVRVPGLAPLVNGTTASIMKAQFTGWTVHHGFRSNWYLNSTYKDELQAIATSMADSTAGRYLAFNDASLPFGGRFSVNNTISPWGVGGGHRTHTHGIDIHVAWCYATTTGVDEFNPAASCGTPAVEISRREFERVAEAQNADVALETQPLHYHIRFRAN